VCRIQYIYVLCAPILNFSCRGGGGVALEHSLEIGATLVQHFFKHVRAILATAFLNILYRREAIPAIFIFSRHKHNVYEYLVYCSRVKKFCKFLAVRRVGVMTLRECCVDRPFPFQAFSPVIVKIFNPNKCWTVTIQFGADGL
jgi:hypothetical protein